MLGGVIASQHHVHCYEVTAENLCTKAVGMTALILTFERNYAQPRSRLGARLRLTLVMTYSAFAPLLLGGVIASQ
jgi:hypothetical protein